MELKEFKDIKLRCYEFSLVIIQLIDSINIKQIFYSLITKFSTLRIRAIFSEIKRITIGKTS